MHGQIYGTARCMATFICWSCHVCLQKDGHPVCSSQSVCACTTSANDSEYEAWACTQYYVCVQVRLRWRLCDMIQLFAGSCFCLTRAQSKARPSLMLPCKVRVPDCSDWESVQIQLQYMQNHSTSKNKRWRPSPLKIIRNSCTFVKEIRRSISYTT